MLKTKARRFSALGKRCLKTSPIRTASSSTGSLVDYQLPRFTDLPDSFTTFIMEGGGGPGPYGAKGMGEGGILAVAPAIGNAVYAATGIRLQAVPLTPELVRNGIENRKG